MKDSKHTPGPWHLNEEADQILGGKHGATSIANVFTHRSRWEGHPSMGEILAEQDANARLIAAAPDLLHACTQVLATIEAQHEHTVVDNGRMMKLRAAIAKATGQH